MDRVPRPARAGGHSRWALAVRDPPPAPHVVSGARPVSIRAARPGRRGRPWGRALPRPPPPWCPDRAVRPIRTGTAVCWTGSESGRGIQRTLDRGSVPSNPSISRPGMGAGVHDEVLHSLRRLPMGRPRRLRVPFPTVNADAAQVKICRYLPRWRLRHGCGFMAAAAAAVASASATATAAALA